MNEEKVKVAEYHQKQTVLHIITLAFSGDPFMRWVFPTVSEYLINFPAMVNVYCAEQSLRQGSTRITENLGGAAIWLSPQTEYDESSALTWVKKNVNSRRKEEFLQVLSAMDEYHPHGEQPCWYLPFIGVDTVFQGQGLGAVLMSHMNEVFDSSQATAYLESSNPNNISLYQRAGFEIMGEIRMGSCPTITPMIRYARS